MGRLSHFEGKPPFMRMPDKPKANDERCDWLTYVTCPKCGQKIPEPFSKHGGPVPYIHRRHKVRGGGRCNARLIVTPSERSALEVGRRESIESALIRALKAAV